jgi:hypothetical protein
MPVPDTTTFSLDDVRVELSGSNPYSLSDAFTDADDDGFDGTYEGSKDRLSNFRNYSNVTITAYSTSNLASAGASGACSYIMDITYYHNGSGTYPQVGDTIYTDSGGTTVYSGTERWRKMNAGAGNVASITIQSGVVYDITLCGGGGI